MNDRLPGTTYDNPVWYRKYRIYISDYSGLGMDYTFVHDDYDGAPNAGDHRCGFAESIEACKAVIDEIEDD